MCVCSSLPASVFLPTRLKDLKKIMCEGLGWTDANQLPRETKVMDGENEREIYITFRGGEGRKSGAGTKTRKVKRETQIERERLY